MLGHRRPVSRGEVGEPIRGLPVQAAYRQRNPIRAQVLVGVPEDLSNVVHCGAGQGGLLRPAGMSTEGIFRRRWQLERQAGLQMPFPSGIHPLPGLLRLRMGLVQRPQNPVTTPHQQVPVSPLADRVVEQGRVA
ncbi:hypothetical protein JCM9534A_18530 [Catenuloplanes indicus JCM 9534]